MRAIDADAFKDYIRGACEEMKHLYKDNGAWAKEITESFCKDIDEQPTIQPEPHWIPVTENCDCDKMDKCEKLQLPPASCSEFPNNSDAISRQAAIEALKRVPGVGNRALDKIRELPPITVEQDWIPVSKEMPPLRHDVWLTVFFREKWNVAEGYRQDGEFMFWNNGRLDSVLDEENRVIAWMPKPEPFKGAET